MSEQNTILNYPPLLGWFITKIVSLPILDCVFSISRLFSFFLVVRLNTNCILCRMIILSLNETIKCRGNFCCKNPKINKAVFYNINLMLQGSISIYLFYSTKEPQSDFNKNVAPTQTHVNNAWKQKSISRLKQFSDHLLTGTKQLNYRAFFPYVQREI